jgi:hypothetical protein
LLDKSDTQWLMHYHICADIGYGPPFWSKIFTSHFRIGSEWDHEEIADEITIVVADTEERELKPRDARSTATVFLKSYIEDDALASLGIIENTSPNHYVVLESAPPSIWVFALALLDYWQAHYPTRQTINLDDLYIDGGLGDIFMMGGGRVSSYLNQLEQEGYLAVQSVAPPYQLALLQRDPRPLLENLYGHDRPS